MKKLIATCILSLGLFIAYGQMTDWRGEFHLGNFAIYDYDLNRYSSNVIEVYSTVVIDIDRSGTGRLSIFNGGNKSSYTIVRATYDESGEQMTMTCENDNGGRFYAYGVCHYKTCIQALILDIRSKNTAAVYFYDNAHVAWTPVR